MIKRKNTIENHKEREYGMRHKNSRRGRIRIKNRYKPIKTRIFLKNNVFCKNILKNRVVGKEIIRIRLFPKLF